MATRGRASRSGGRAAGRAEHPRPAVAADTVLFTLDDGAALRMLLIRRRRPPHRGEWAFPGGFVEVGDVRGDQGEDLEAAARRELAEETGLDDAGIRLTQLGTWGRPDRDPRMRVLSVVYVGLVPAATVGRVRAGDDAAEARWLTPAQARREGLAFDHAEILRAALGWLRARLRDSALVTDLGCTAFTEVELRALYSALDPGYLEGRTFQRALARLVEDGFVRRVPNTSPQRLRFRTAARGR